MEIEEIGPVRQCDLEPEPMAEFGKWFEKAKGTGIIRAEAMTLATATADGRPSARIVLLKGFDERGMMFYTNYKSRKAQELEGNPHASLVFFWDAIRRQVRVEGRVERVSVEESKVYFDSRPFESRLEAWASPQSEPIDDRSVLEDRMRELAVKFANGEVPLPPFWGGFRVVPHRAEFWVNRASRVHDRFCYLRQEEGGWKIVRLAP
ncbi:MAG: pyridoxamine 5'-phosphate oxidase [bacterium]|nr:pyridoxamine 5'-phosphate oxidase [bacterium]